MPVTRRALFLRETTTRQASYWKGSRSAASVPVDAILTESGEAILTELEQYLLTES